MFGITKATNTGKRWQNAAAQLREQIKDQREREAKDRLLRQETIYKKLNHEPLPKELCERELNTTWVSPTTKRLMPAAEDRFVLRKRSAEAFRLTMATPSGPLLARPLSTPALTSQLRSNSKKDESSIGVGTASGATLPSLAPAGGVSSPSAPSASGLAQNRDPVGVLRPINAPETISLGPPGRLRGELTLRRFDDQKRGFIGQSFALYKQEYDVLSGKKKVPTDAKKLKEDEDSTVWKMRTMNSGPPKRMTPWVPPATLVKVNTLRRGAEGREH